MNQKDTYKGAGPVPIVGRTYDKPNEISLGGGRGTIPQSAHWETTEERIAELTAKANALPPESTARQTIENVLRGYAVNSQ